MCDQCQHLGSGNNANSYWWTYKSRTRAMVCSYLAQSACRTGWLSTNNKPRYSSSTFKVSCVSSGTCQTKARAWSCLAHPPLSGWQTSHKPLMNQGCQCDRIGENIQILAQIIGHIHQGCQSKLHQQEAHSVERDMHILMENQLRMILRILHRRNSMTIIATATLCRQSWNILHGIINDGLVGGNNSLYSNGTTPGSILCGISACGSCISLVLGRLLSSPLKLCGSQNENVARVKRRLRSQRSNRVVQIYL